MFNEFRVRYPKGGLISELLTIDRGKYFVRVLVEVEGVTLATGLAAADTVELAEDQARGRALAVLGILPTTATEDKETRSAAADLPMAFTPTPQPQRRFSQESLRQERQSPLFPEAPKVDTAPLFFSEPKPPEISSDALPISWEPNAIPFADESLPAEEMPSVGDVSKLETPAPILPNPDFEPQPSSFLNNSEAMPESQLYPPPLTPVPNYPPLESQANMAGIEPTDEPLDISNIIARTNIEMKRLGWTKMQGRDYLERTYNKKMRAELTDQELLEFLHYLESQQTPVD